MIHLFKLSNQQADLFISRIDFSKREIDYSVREKDTGVLLEPPNKSKLTITESIILFDGRPVPLDLAKHISVILN